jgi:hypothetical protein
MVFWSYNLRGQCEEDWDGLYATREECEQASKSVTVEADEDATLKSIAKDVAKAVVLAPSDRVKLFKLLTGLDIRADASQSLLLAYYSDDYWALSRCEGGRDYLREKVGLSSIYFMLFDLHDFIMECVEFRVIDGMEVTNWRQHTMKVDLELKKVVKGINIVFLDEAPVDEKRMVQLLTYILLSNGIPQQDQIDERWFEWVKVNAVPVITEIYGAIPKY